MFEIIHISCIAHFYVAVFAYHVFDLDFYLSTTIFSFFGLIETKVARHIYGRGHAWGR